MVAKGMISIGEAAERLGVSSATLRRWDAAGKLRATRHPINGYRHYRFAQLEQVDGERDRVGDGVVVRANGNGEDREAEKGDSMASTGYIRICEAAEWLGVCTQTLRRWDAAGKLRALRHPMTGFRYYRRAELEPYLLSASPGARNGNADSAGKTEEPAHATQSPAESAVSASAAIAPDARKDMERVQSFRAVPPPLVGLSWVEVATDTVPFFAVADGPLGGATGAVGLIAVPNAEEGNDGRTYSDTDARVLAAGGPAAEAPLTDEEATLLREHVGGLLLALAETLEHADPRLGEGLRLARMHARLDQLLAGPSRALRVGIGGGMSNRRFAVTRGISHLEDGRVWVRPGLLEAVGGQFDPCTGRFVSLFAVLLHLLDHQVEPDYREGGAYERTARTLVVLQNELRGLAVFARGTPAQLQGMEAAIRAESANEEAGAGRAGGRRRTLG